MAGLQDVEPSCAICGASSVYGECRHEGERLALALDQAMARWTGLAVIRDWALGQAKQQVLQMFREMKQSRYETHMGYLQTLPCYTVYQRFPNAPPLAPAQLNLLHQRITEAQSIYQAGVDEDWRRSCMKYPDILDYYLSLVDYEFPDDSDAVIRDPRFGAAPVKEPPRRIKPRRDSVERGNGYRKRSRRRSRGRTPPPMAPMAVAYRR